MKNRRGFTLLEVLLAMAIAVIVVATMAGTITASFNLKRAAEIAVETVRDAENTGNTWEIDMRNIVPPSAYSQQDVQQGNLTVDPMTGLTTQPSTSTTGTTGTTGTSGTATGGITGQFGSNDEPYYLFGPFYGDSQSITCYTTGTEPTAPLNSGVIFVEYSLARQNDGTTALMRQVETNMLGDNDPSTFPSGLPAEVIVPNVQNVEFDYFDPVALQWTNFWDSTSVDQLPMAVRMILTVNGDRPGEPQRTITRVAAIPCATTQPNNAGATTGNVTGLLGN